MALLLAETFCISLFFTNLFIVVDLIKRADASLLSEEMLSSVDVFVLSYNEGGALPVSTRSVAKATYLASGRFGPHSPVRCALQLNISFGWRV